MDKNMETCLSDDREKAIDHVYNVYFNENDMLDNKYFDVDTNDFLIIW